MLKPKLKAAERAALRRTRANGVAKAPSALRIKGMVASVRRVARGASRPADASTRDRLKATALKQVRRD